MGVVVFSRGVPSTLTKKFRLTCRSLARRSARCDTKSYTGAGKGSITRSEEWLLVLTASDLMFQNGFGAWQRVQYRCTYDTDRLNLISVDGF